MSVAVNVFLFAVMLLLGVLHLAEGNYREVKITKTKVKEKHIAIGKNTCNE